MSGDQKFLTLLLGDMTPLEAMPLCDLGVTAGFRGILAIETVLV